MHAYPVARAATTLLIASIFPFKVVAADAAKISPAQEELKKIAEKTALEIAAGVEAEKAAAVQRRAAAATAAARDVSSVRAQLQNAFQQAFAAAPDEATREQLMAEYVAKLNVAAAQEEMARRQAAAAKGGR